MQWLLLNRKKNIVDEYEKEARIGDLTAEYCMVKYSSHHTEEQGGY